MKKTLLAFSVLFSAIAANAQTDIDALFMPQNNLCGGVLAGKSTWNHYWEGQRYRSNANIGSVINENAMAMANYGITGKLNLIAMVPYVKNRATAGTLHSQQGIQDLTLMLKKELWVSSVAGFEMSAVGIVGGSTPLTHYVADYLPLSIGFGSKTAMARLMFDAQKGHWFGTVSGTYTTRSQVQIDRNSYYTTELIYSNMVAMPDVMGYNVRLGWRDHAEKIFELYVDGMNTLGGFNIRRNDMPFLSNNMDMTRVGVNMKYPFLLNGLSLMAIGATVIAGRNVGQTTSMQLGLVYQGDFSKK